MQASKQSFCIKVPIKLGEFYRKMLTEQKLIDNELAIKHNNTSIFIPLLKNPKDVNGTMNKSDCFKDEKIEFLQESFEIFPKKIQSYKSLISIPAELQNHLPTSYDIIGSIAIIKLSDSLKNYEHQIGEAILNVQNNLKTVAIDRGVMGEYRIRQLEIIAGDSNTETVHRMYGIRFLLDVTKVYFSPRLSKEHYRVSKLVQPGEDVLDMFAGIGPFSIMISKKSKASKIYSIDINSAAIDYLIKNIELNKIQNIFPIVGDVRMVIDQIPFVDRIIMNLPMESEKYLNDAISKLKPVGMIHLHKICSENDIEPFKDSLKSIIENKGFELMTIEEHNLGSYSPRLDHYCLDLKIEKKLNSDKIL